MNKEKRNSFKISYLFISLLLSFPGAYIFISLRNKRGKHSLSLSLIFIISFWLAIIYGIYKKDVPWQYYSSILLGVNFLFGLILCFWNIKDNPNQIDNKKTLNDIPGSITQMLQGFVWGSFLGGMLLVVNYLICQNIWDPFIGHVLLIKYSTLSFLKNVYQQLLVGAIWGGILGVVYSRRNRVNTIIVNRFCFSYFMVCFLFLTNKAIILLIPRFWNSMNNNLNYNKFNYEVVFFDIVFLLFGLFLILYLLRNKCHRASMVKSLASIFLIGLSFSLYVGVLFGQKSQHLLLWGRFAEISGNYESALKLYGKSLLSHSTDNIESYLQYRIGIMHYKKGELDFAKQAFQKVIVKYSANDVLVKRSSYFLRQLNAEDKKGETYLLKQWNIKTALKSSYCAPNSLAYVLQYWNKNVDARRIGEILTKLESGTSLLQILHFLEKYNLKHYTVQLADKADIIKALSFNVPVLAYIPGHVFVIHGYDHVLDCLNAYDVAQADYWVEYPWPDFFNEWEKAGRMIGFIYPAEQGEYYENKLGLEAKKSDAVYLRLSLNRHNLASIKNTKAVMKKALNLNPNDFVSLIDYMNIRSLEHEKRNSINNINKKSFMEDARKYWKDKRNFNIYLDSYLINSIEQLNVLPEDKLYFYNLAEDHGYANWLTHYFTAVALLNLEKYLDVMVANKKFASTVKNKKVLNITKSRSYLPYFINSQFVESVANVQANHINKGMHSLVAYVMHKYNNYIADVLAKKWFLNKDMKYLDYYTKLKVMTVLIKKFPYETELYDKFIQLLKEKVNKPKNEDENLIASFKLKIRQYENYYILLQELTNSLVDDSA